MSRLVFPWVSVRLVASRCHMTGYGLLLVACRLAAQSPPPSFQSHRPSANRWCILGREMRWPVVPPRVRTVSKYLDWVADSCWLVRLAGRTSL